VASFVYQCLEGHQKVVSRSVHDVEVVPKCDCGKTMVRVWTAPPVAFRGHGWGHQ
jgi:predicted nucleic acid-binding Zn ribbon protein